MKKDVYEWYESVEEFRNWFMEKVWNNQWNLIAYQLYKIWEDKVKRMMNNSIISTYLF